MHPQLHRTLNSQRVLLALVLVANLVILPAGIANWAGSRKPVQPTRATQSVIPNAPAKVQSPTSEPQAQAAYGKLPLVFEANQGQTDSRVNFITRAGGATVFLTGTEAVFALRTADCALRNHNRLTRGVPAGDLFAGAELQTDTCNSQTASFSMRIDGASSASQVEGLEKLPGIANYFIGNDPAQWHANIPTYARVRYQGIYDGVDLEYYSAADRRLEYDFVVKPGADASQISLSFDGADSIKTDTATGDLLIATSAGEMRQHKPTVYQDVNGDKREIESGYQLLADNRVCFVLGAYDQSQPLVIDPKLAYSTYLGGSGADFANGVAVDSGGNAYITGLTDSTNFPTTNLLQPALGGLGDVFVTKLNAQGSARIYSTYLGGSLTDEGRGIAVDPTGNAYIIGDTDSTNFPTVNPLQPANAGSRDGFVLKLNPLGSALLYSTYLGGSGNDFGNRIAVDSFSNAYISGNTTSPDFPTNNAAQAVYVGNADAFVTKLNSDGSSRVFSTYLGGSSNDAALGIAVDSAGNVYVTGATSSPDFPTANALQPLLAGTEDAFVTKLNPAGELFIYSTYLGGSSSDGGSGIAVDSAGAVYLCGSTRSIDFPRVNPVQLSFAGSLDGYVSKLNASGNALVYSTYLGGNGTNQALDIAVDSAGSAVVTGYTDATNFPTVNPIQPAIGGLASDAFVTRLNAAGSAYLYSTYLGGSSRDVGNGIAVDSTGVYLAGATDSTNFPTANPIQAASGGPTDGFITKIASGKIFIVNVTSDGHDANPGDGICQTSTPGTCSLRAAIEEANAFTGTDTIDFNIPGTGVHTIVPQSALPQISDPAIIDGYSQPGASANTLTNDDNAVILIELDGQFAGAGASGLSTLNSPSTIQGLSIYSFDFSGIRLNPPGGNLVRGNFIGLTANGSIAPGNGTYGVFAGSDNNTIGGVGVGARNVISGNGTNLSIADSGGIQLGHNLGNIVQNNFIGTDKSGTHSMPNGKGVRILGGINSIIGGTTPLTGNLISGNSAVGIEITGGAATGNQIQGNFIGADVNGKSPVPNSTGIIISGASGNLIGGTTPGARNLISGNTQSGVEIGGNNNQVQGNFIGTDVSGVVALANKFGNGVFINGSGTPATNNLIGGTTPAARNVLSGNGDAGVELKTASSNFVQGNFIGVGADGSTPVRNNSFGIVFGDSATNNTIGGVVGAGNVIAFNFNGVVVDFANDTGNAILSNSIFSNTLLGIDLGGDQVTPNDVGDTDTGPNNLQNFPVLNLATTNGVTTTVNGALDSTPNTSFTIQLFSNPSCDPLGNGEGKTFVGSVALTTGGDGHLMFSTPLLTNVAAGQFITATATDPTSNTSEFSPCTRVTAAATPTPTPTPTPPPTPTPTPTPTGSTLQFGQTFYSVFEDCTALTITVAREGDTSTPATVDYATQSGTASDRSDFDTAVGTLSFAAGETAKSFDVLISEDSYVEGTESFVVALSNPTGATLGSQSTASVQIFDDSPESSGNPIDTPDDFVCQHYHDFLNREDDSAGLSFWTNTISSCGNDANCITTKRVNASGAFFLSIEFQETGGFAIRVQRAAFGRKSIDPAKRMTYLGFIHDARIVGDGVIVGQPGYDARLEANKQAYINQIIASTAFISAYPTAMTADQYVDALFSSAGVTPTSSERQAAINAFDGGGTTGRAAALRSVSDSNSLRSAEFNASFVLLQYFGYLRRNPTDAPDNNDNGFQFWLGKLNAFNGDFQKAEMVRAFISSTEYRSRFGQP